MNTTLLHQFQSRSADPLFALSIRKLSWTNTAHTYQFHKSVFFSKETDSEKSLLHVTPITISPFSFKPICFIVFLILMPKAVHFFSWFGGILGSASGAEFPVSPSNHVGFTPRLFFSSTHQSPESFTHQKTGWAQDAWLQWSYENWYFHLDIRLSPY